MLWLDQPMLEGMKAIHQGVWSKVLGHLASKDALAGSTSTFLVLKALENELGVKHILPKKRSAVKED
jgi:hypothetical protein